MKFKKIAALLIAGVMMASALLGGCGNKIDTEKTVITVDGEEVSLGFANFVARFQQANYDAFYRSYFGDEYWTQDMSGSGEDMETSVKSDILENLELLYMLEDHMADYDVEVTEEEQAEITAAAEQFLADNTDEAIEQVGATQEYIERMLYLNVVQARMYDAIIAEVSTEVSDEEAARKTISYISIDTQTYTDDSGATQTYSDEEAAEQKEKAEAVAEAAKEDLDAAAEANDYTVKTASYGTDENGGLPDDVIAAADELENGEVSELIDADGVCYVVRMDSTFDQEATDAAKESIISTRQSEHYTEVTEGYKEAAEVTVDEDAWAQVKFDSLFNVVSGEDAEDGEQADTTEDSDAAQDTTEDSDAAQDAAEDSDAAQDADSSAVEE